MELVNGGSVGGGERHMNWLERGDAAEGRVSRSLVRVWVAAVHWSGVRG